MQKNKYIHPIAKEHIIRISTAESEAHKIYPHSIDYIVPIATPVRAAADGIIIDVKDNSDAGGEDQKFENDENFIEIRHKNDEYSYYGHIRKDGAFVKIGEKVKAGQLIGESGNTGWRANLQEPHLHFMVGKYKYETIKINFQG
jgi:murein DD-endopeptidase MepM/ murein hydrolase activator NlpD